ncbi:hypothetical protein CF15_04970 [Pyrodictium occultum]|uniref:4Fe-4S ferredoxin-type domain-containing protein n=1 Tax=Pyrodictium occultum TaxID=2309 RepID=A0A0V8RVY7_PYROC|nr:4Fe-4S binding protein [Pyrodictium occultum]KSW12122.1 hypothetical protein CF15_04970 [Pyrodictium occultum]
MARLVALPGASVEGAVEADGLENAAEKAAELAGEGERVLIVGDGAWRAAELAWERLEKTGGNPLLVWGLDPVEARAAGVPLEAAAAARRSLLEWLQPEEAGLRTAPGKKLGRRDLLRSGPAAVFEAVDTPVVVDPQACSLLKGCRACIDSCPYGALEGKPPRADPYKCTGCGLCLSACPAGVLEAAGAGEDPAWRYLRLLGARGPGYLLILCRRDAAWAVEALRGAEPAARAYILPLTCPGQAGLRLLLAAWGAGLAPVYVCSSGSVKACGVEAFQRYLETVAADYTALTGLKPVFAAERGELGEVLQREPGLKPAAQGAEKAWRSAVEAVKARPPGSRVETAAPLLGVVEVDPSRCTLCSACSRACPTGALEMVEGGEGARLLFHPDRCPACSLCVDTCPEDAIRLTRAVDPGLLSGGTRLLHSDETAHCIVCGRPIGPLSMLRKVEARLRASGLPEETIMKIYLCSECKQKAALGLIDLSKYLGEQRKRGQAL